jgi:EmrB/QacA subfamily drug resistance transporter
MAAVMAAMFMAALEGTVVGTAMPSIAARFGDLSNYGWVFSAYLLAQTVTSISFGRLADIAGRKAAIVLGLSIFIAGSLASGFAWSMGSLIAFRVVQGIGAGAILPLSMTIIGDLYPPNERGKAQSLIATVFGTSSVAGPIVGGVIVEQASWSWIFWINVPIGLIAIVAFLRLLPKHEASHQQPLNIRGNLVLALTMAGALLAVGWAGSGKLDLAGTAVATSLLLGLTFVRIERRASSRIFEPSVWLHPGIAFANGSTALAAMSIIGLTAFLPLFMQVQLGSPPVVAGLALTAIAMGWPIGATVAGWYQLKIGLRRTMLFGAVSHIVGTIAFVTLDSAAGFFHAAGGSFLMGLGMGLLTSAALMIVQEAVPVTQRGAATSANVFARNLGSVIGVSVFAAIFNIALGARTNGFDLHELEQKLALHGKIDLPAAAVRQIGAGLHWVFVAMACCSLVVLLLVLFARSEQKPAPHVS